MKLRSSHQSNSTRARVAVLAVALGVLTPVLARATQVPSVLDDFSDPKSSTIGIDRILMDDSSIGGGSHANQSTEDGVLTIKGEIVPARGQPGFISLVLLLSPKGEPRDLSSYEGIRLKVRVVRGGLSVLAASTEIQNFDFHAAAIARTSGGLHEVKIPFSSLKRVWSEQTPLNRKTIASINLVASGLQKGAFAYEIDEVGFY